MYLVESRQATMCTKYTTPSHATSSTPSPHTPTNHILTTHTHQPRHHTHPPTTHQHSHQTPTTHQHGYHHPPQQNLHSFHSGLHVCFLRGGRSGLLGSLVHLPLATPQGRLGFDGAVSGGGLGRFW